MIRAALMVPLIIGSLAGSGFVVNEWSHGGLSQALGLGHHHMLDPGAHCPQGAVHGTRPHHEAGHGPPTINSTACG